MRYLRMFSNAAIAGTLGSIYVSLLILQLNPNLPLYPGTLAPLLITIGLSYGAHLTAVFYAFIVIRGLARAMRNDDLFIRFAAAGLAIMFGVQAAINMSVNLRLIPAKGMTLPFISYGGSSMISLGYTMGMLLALTREQPRAAMLAPDLSAAEAPV